MTTTSEIKKKLQQHKTELRNNYSVKSLGIFGSFARNEQSDTSDIDILVDFEKPIGLQFVDLAEYLESILHAKVDLVSKNAVKPKLMKYIGQDIQYV
ncbi:MAG: nucleotidyltransferase family protein [Ignavibacteriales bacterium]|nr:nucleotidyltransferase family protein [Ignavibacteriales bacterium]